MGLTSLPPPPANDHSLETSLKEVVVLVAPSPGDEALLVKMIQQETTPPLRLSHPALVPGLYLPSTSTLLDLAHHMLPLTQATMWLAILLALCCLTSDTHGAHSPDFCSKDLNSSVKPGFPKAIKTNNPGVLKAARHSVEKFNNCTNDIFLFKESRVNKALVQVVKGLKYMLELEISRTTCRKTVHPHLDNCDFQTNPALKRTLYCYSEVWVIPWLHSFEVPVLRCH